MAHEIDMSNDRANMAFIGQTPWHGLGFQLTEGASLEEWQSAAGMNFELKTYPVMYFDPATSCQRLVPNRRVVVRDDTHNPLSVVSDGFNLVQPRDVLEFYRDLLDAAGFKMNTAGVLKGGRKFWALAEIGQEATIMKQDKIEGYLLLATSCDMTLASTAMFTSVRVVCNNTLGFAVQEGEDRTAAERKERPYVKVPHNAKFDPVAVKAELGLAAKSWDTFIERANALAERKVDDKTALEWLVKVYGDASKPVEEQDASAARFMQKVHELFKGAGHGSAYKSADGTAWGLVNAVTEFHDHLRGAQTIDSRLDRSWFGDGAIIKARAFEEALVLIA